MALNLESPESADMAKSRAEVLREMDEPTGKAPPMFKPRRRPIRSRAREKAEDSLLPVETS
jgi:hypothetical protein